ncbi:MAG: type III-A CRISPR-associated RAMP protein Csm5 [Bacilli bacterium]|jgi:CRISPR/Cas system CSM-associated protein Csm5 (group 7 of RAMP superfamily)
MGKITVLTPVHISSGNVYLSILIHDNKRYELMDILQTSSDPKRFLDNNLNNMLLRDNITVSKKQFFDALNLEPRKLDQKTPLYKINNKTEKQIIDGNISESVKNLSAPYIPGSTLKGYVSNIMWNDIFIENQEINKYYSNLFEEAYQNITSGRERKRELRNLERKIKGVENELKGIMQLIGFHDVIFNELSNAIYESNRYLNGKKVSKKLPVGVVEVIDEGEIAESKFYFTGMEISRDYMDMIRSGIEIDISKSKNKDGLSDNAFHYQKNIKQKILNEIYVRILKFKEWFPKANQRFMINLINQELSFLDTINNDEIDTNSLRNILESMKTRIEKNELIIQVGKFTSFLAKSYGSAFGELYREYFTEVFSPDIKNKTVPKIDTMNLIVKNGRGTIPFGFIRIDEF